MKVLPGWTAESTLSEVTLRDRTEFEKVVTVYYKSNDCDSLYSTVILNDHGLTLDMKEVRFASQENDIPNPPILGSKPPIDSVKIYDVGLGYSEHIGSIKIEGA